MHSERASKRSSICASQTQSRPTARNSQIPRPSRCRTSPQRNDCFTEQPRDDFSIGATSRSRPSPIWLAGSRRSSAMRPEPRSPLRMSSVELLFGKTERAAPRLPAHSAAGIMRPRDFSRRRSPSMIYSKGPDGTSRRSRSRKQRRTGSTTCYLQDDPGM